jgi:PAS domain S-box-containing protein
MSTDGGTSFIGSMWRGKTTGEMLTRDLRKTGIDIIGGVPWGTHFCQFYENGQDLLDILIPYFKAGLENNEFCLWVTCEPVNKKMALQAMKRAFPESTRYLSKGQLEVISYGPWYLRDGAFDMQRVLKSWDEKLQQALSKGYEGMRVTGNTAWLEAANWRDFTEYEAAVNDAIGGSRMIALCTYWLERCGAREVMDVVRNHEFALVKTRRGWEIIESSAYKKAKEALLDGDRKYRMLWENLQEGIWAIDVDGRTTMVNESMAGMLGYPAEEIIGKSFYSFMSQDSVAKAARKLEQRAQGIKERHEFEFQRADGSPLFVIMETSPLLDANGKFSGALAGVMDITDRKATQDALQFERDKLDSIMNAMEDGVYIVNQDYDVEYANPALIKEFGSFEGRKCYQYLHDNDQECKACRIQEVLAGGTIRREWFSSKNNRVYELLDTPLRKPDGSVCKLEIFRDITERKDMEDALRQSEDKYRSIVETAGEGIVLADIKGTITFVNPQGAAMLGYDGEELLGKSVFDLVAGNDLARLESLWQKKADLSGRYETMVHRKDGTPVWLLVNVTPMFDHEGVFSGILSMATDMTALKQTEEMLRTLFEASLIGIATEDMDGHIYEANNAFLDMVGYNRDDLESGRLDWPSMTPLEYRDLDETAVAELLGSGHCAPYQKEYWRKDGTRVPILKGAALLGTVDDVPRWVCFALDIGPQKRAEQQLAWEKEMLRTIMENTGAQLAYLDTDFNFVMVNSSYARGSGHSFEELVSQNHFALFPSEENEAIFKRVRDTGEPEEFHDKPFCFADQPERGVTYWDWTLAPVKDESGKVHGLVLSLIDTTDRVRVGEELRRHREELESLVGERTSQLKESYDRLKEEIGEREQAEEKLRALSHRLVQLQEEERRAIARELHDEIGQSLTVLKLFLDRYHSSRSDGVGSADLEQAQTMVKRVMGQLRNLSLTLRPTMLDDLGLLPTLQWHMERYSSQTRINVNFRHSGLQKKIPREVSTAAYRIVQEALTNVARHANTGEVMVCVRAENGMLLIEVEDHGVGFDIAKAREAGGVGLSGMSERVLSLNGSLTIESTPESGTYLLAELPIPDGSRNRRRQKRP